MLNPTPEELELREKISRCTDEKEKAKLESELFQLVEERFEIIRNSPFC